MPRCSLSHHLCRRAITFPPSSASILSDNITPDPFVIAAGQPRSQLKYFTSSPWIQLPADDLKPCLPALRLLLALFPRTKNTRRQLKCSLCAVGLRTLQSVCVGGRSACVYEREGEINSDRFKQERCTQLPQQSPWFTVIHTD